MAKFPQQRMQILSTGKERLMSFVLFVLMHIFNLFVQRACWRKILVCVPAGHKSYAIRLWKENCI